MKTYKNVNTMLFSEFVHLRLRTVVFVNLSGCHEANIQHSVCVCLGVVVMVVKE